jgi:hypothetical protein
MKGRLFLRDDKWYVEFQIINSFRSLPLHADSERLLSLRSDKQPEQMIGEKVEFEFEDVWENGQVGINGLRYAKLTQCNGLNFEKSTELVDDRQAYLETLAKVLAKTWFYGDWKWETPNERVMHFIMVELGLYPFLDEDSMTAKTQVSEDYYSLAAKYVRGYSENEMIDNEFGNLKKNLERLDYWKLGYNTAKQKLFTQEEMIEWTMRMIGQYAVGNTNIWDREILKESLPKNK